MMEALMCDEVLSIDNDEHLLRLYNLPLLKKRAIQELHGISAALIYDGEVTDEEIGLITKWLRKHDEVHADWPVSRLIAMLHEILKDEVITPAERKELFAFLSGISASPETPTADSIFNENAKIEISGKNFLFTGKLEFGKRSKAEAAVYDRGGFCYERFTPVLDYLVVGSLGQEQWKYSRYGAKIEACMNASTAGKTNCTIVREAAFVRAIVSM